ncbi:uncharacterized protein [Parasteatoda tepidariorum]|uniref:uncharacterized protein n=1 Tax=Parasteatoda tepidariorum TaxID=114398 RepID=UPI0039BCF7F8
MITKEFADTLCGVLFPRKLWLLATNKDVDSVQWSEDGLSVRIDSIGIEKECFIPQVFNVTSNQHVLRQLSYYQFEKIDNKIKMWEFKHSCFRADREDLLCYVKRSSQKVFKKFATDYEKRRSKRRSKRSINYAAIENQDDSEDIEKEPGMKLKKGTRQSKRVKEEDNVTFEPRKALSPIHSNSYVLGSSFRNNTYQELGLRKDMITISHDNIRSSRCLKNSIANPKRIPLPNQPEEIPIPRKRGRPKRQSGNQNPSTSQAFNSYQGFEDKSDIKINLTDLPSPARATGQYVNGSSRQNGTQQPGPTSSQKYWNQILVKDDKFLNVTETDKVINDIKLNEMNLDIAASLSYAQDNDGKIFISSPSDKVFLKLDGSEDLFEIKINGGRIYVPIYQKNGMVNSSIPNENEFPFGQPQILNNMMSNFHNYSKAPAISKPSTGTSYSNLNSIPDSVNAENNQAALNDYPVIAVSPYASNFRMPSSSYHHQSIEPISNLNQMASYPISRCSSTTSVNQFKSNNFDGSSFVRDIESPYSSNPYTYEQSQQAMIRNLSATPIKLEPFDENPNPFEALMGINCNKTSPDILHVTEGDRFGKLYPETCTSTPENHHSNSWINSSPIYGYSDRQTLNNYVLGKNTNSYNIASTSKSQPFRMQNTPRTSVQSFARTNCNEQLTNTYTDIQNSSNGANNNRNQFERICGNSSNFYNINSSCQPVVSEPSPKSLLYPDHQRHKSESPNETRVLFDDQTFDLCEEVCFLEEKYATGNVESTYEGLSVKTADEQLISGEEHKETGGSAEALSFALISMSIQDHLIASASNSTFKLQSETSEEQSNLPEKKFSLPSEQSSLLEEQSCLPDEQSNTSNEKLSASEENSILPKEKLALEDKPNRIKNGDTCIGQTVLMTKCPENAPVDETDFKKCSVDSKDDVAGEKVSADINRDEHPSDNLQETVAQTEGDFAMGLVQDRNNTTESSTFFNCKMLSAKAFPQFRSSEKRAGIVKIESDLEEKKGIQQISMKNKSDEIEVDQLTSMKNKSIDNEGNQQLSLKEKNTENESTLENDPRKAIVNFLLDQIKQNVNFQWKIVNGKFIVDGCKFEACDDVEAWIKTTYK